MEQSTSKKIRLGIFIVIGTLILIAALYFVGNRQHLFSKNITVKALFANVNGLQIGNTVRFSGIDIGTVQRINMQTDTLIMVEMRIEEEMTSFIKSDAIATIGSDGLVGNMLINILPQQGKSRLLIDGDTLVTFSKISTQDMLTTLNATNENAALLTADLLKITTAINNAEGTIGMLIKDPDLAKTIKGIAVDAKTMSEDAIKTVREIERFTKNLNAENNIASLILTDTVATAQLKRVLQNLERSSDDIKDTTTDIKTIVEEVKSSGGALNYVVKDTLLVQKLKITVDNVKKSSDQLHENLEALKHNILFRGYFKKQQKKTEKSRKTNQTTQDEN